MKPTTVYSYVEVKLPQRRALLVACWIGLVLVVAVLVGGLVLGASVSIFAVVPVVLLARGIRSAASPSEVRAVDVGVSVTPARVVVEMPGTRLWSGRYVDQRYTCAVDAVESAGMDETGMFTLRARLLVSEAVEGGVVLDRREHEFYEVSFRPVSDEDARALRSAFEG